VQQALADAPPTPICQLQYLPGDAWETSGTPDNTTSSSSTDGSTPPPAVVSQCNNGTRVSNKIGAEINLKFTGKLHPFFLTIYALIQSDVGTEVSLLMVPGQKGGAYDVQLDDEDPITLSNYKPDVTSCQVATPWSRNNLTNTPHTVSIIVKGSPAGSDGGSQIEFNGLM
jgi:hypothetical protein